MDGTNNKTQFQIDILRNIIFQYKIPFGFDLLDCLEQNDEGKPYIIVINGVPAKIHFKRIYGYRYGENGGINIAPYSRVTEDRSGILSHSIIQIWFDKQTFDSDKYDKKLLKILPDQLLGESIIYLNKFIRIYKSITNQFWIRQIVKKDIFNIDVFFVDENDNQTSTHILIPPHQTVEFNGGKEFAIKTSDEELFRKLLVEDFFNLRNELKMNIIDNYYLGNYNIALLQSVTEFEHYIYSNLKNKLSGTKLDKIKKRDGCGCMVGISEVCERGINEYFDVDFKSTIEFQNMKEKALKLRNLIVHGELIGNIEEKQCREGIEAVQKAEEYLMTNVFFGES